MYMPALISGCLVALVSYSETAMIVLIDCNNFYVNCQHSFNPFLTEQPVVVLSNNDGICSGQVK